MSEPSVGEVLGLLVGALAQIERRANAGADRNAYGALRAIRLEVAAALAPALEEQK